MKNEREFYRYELNIPVWFEIEPEVGEPRRERCDVINISQKGIMFEGKIQYEVGKLLGVRFFLPRFGAPVRAVVKVIWTEEITAGERYRIGGEFLELKNADQEMFRLIAEDFSREFASAGVCPNCGYRGKQITLSKDELQLLKKINTLKEKEKEKVIKNISSLLNKSPE